MANETLITDLVAQQALDQLEQLDRKMEGTMAQFKDCAMELAKGLKIPVEVQGDLSALRQLSNDVMQRATQATQQYTQQLQQQQQVIANTTNTISRQLAEQEKVNKAQRTAFTQNLQALDIAERIVGTYEQNTRQLAQYTAELARNKEALKKVEEMRKYGQITDAEAIRRSGNLMAEQNRLKTAMQEVASVVRVQAKEMNAAEGSYVHLSQQLELLKKAQKGLNESEKAGEEGRLLEAEIQNLDARLKDLAADMGEFQRNVGNYAIAQGGLNKTYNEMTETLTALKLQYNEMDEAQRQSAEGQELNASIEQLTEKAGLIKTTMSEVNDAVANSAAGQQITKLTFELTALTGQFEKLSDEEKDSAKGKELVNHMTELTKKIAELKGEMDAVAADAAPQSLRKDLKELTMEIAAATLEYQHMTEEEKNSAAGQELKHKIGELTEQAGELKDVLGDVKESISNSASDTRGFDTLNEVAQATISVFGLCTSAAQALGISNETLEQSMEKVQIAMQSVQALEKLQLITQRQSNVMKGIAILQSKAKAAASKIEAAATASATGATKAQTIAQAAFNVVAKANPYVLLATAILAVVGLIIGYTAATKDATTADVEAKKAADERKESMNNMAQSFGNSAGEMIAKYKVMREQWNALGDDIAAKRKYLVQHKTDFETLAKSAGESADSVGSVQAVEKNYMNNTPNVEKAIKRRAMAMAGYAEYIRITQLKLQELEKLSTFKYKIYREGDRVSRSDFAKAGLTMNNGQKEAAKYDGYGGGIPSGTTWLTAEQASRMTTWSKEQGNKAALEAMHRVAARYDAMAKRAWEYFVKNRGLEPANFAGGDGGGGGKNTPSKGGGGKNTPQVKNAEDIQNELNAILLSGYSYASELEEKYTEDWLNAEKKRIRQKKENDIAAAEKKRDDLKEDIKASKMSEEEKQKAIAKVEAATADISEGIKHQATEEEKKLDNEILEHKQQLAQKEIEKALSQGEAEQVMRDAQYANELEALKDKYAKELAEADGYEEKISEIKKRYQEQTAHLSEQYAIKTAQAQYDILIKQLEAIGAVDEDMIVELTAMVKNGELDAAATILEAYGLTHDEAMELLKSLADAEIGIRTATTDAVIAQKEREADATQEAAQKEKDAQQKRIQNLQDWMQKAGEAIDKISGFVTALYDNQIAKIEELLEAEQTRYDQEVSHIDNLAEHGAITTEEAEIRKRDAAAATAAKQEQLEKKKAQIEYRKAMVEKANTIAQIGMATALGIMQTYAQLGWPAGIPGAIFIGAMGAIQLATALAQPIKAYAEGTKGKPHPGGLALVGDGGCQELVMYDGKAWVTPDKPTLLDLPKGAEVFPDVTAQDLLSLGASLPTAVPRDRATGQPIVINDYSALESRMAANTKAVTKTLNQFSDRMAREMKRQKFNVYIASRI
jgi:chromosome segregation ATPase